MAKKNEIIVRDVTIRTMSVNGMDYNRYREAKKPIDPNGAIANWMCNRNTVEFLGIWETINTPSFTPPSNSRGLEKRQG